MALRNRHWITGSGTSTHTITNQRYLKSGIWASEGAGFSTVTQENNRIEHTMLDVTGRRRAKNAHANPCEHQSLKAIYYDGSGTGWTWIAPTEFPVKGDIAVPYFFDELISLIKTDLSTEVTLPPHTVAENCLPVFGASNLGLPRQVRIDRDPFETDFSVWFPIVDIIQFILPFYRVSKVIRSIRHSETYASLLQKKASFTARDYANQRLGVKFGILPTIRDMIDCTQAIKTCFKKYDEYKAKYKDHIFRYHEKRDVPGYVDPLQTFSGQIALGRLSGNPAIDYQVTQHTNVHSWHGESFYKLHVPELVSFWSRLKQLTDSFGILDPAAIWDLVPFSFVLDWFFVTDRVMHKLKPRLFRCTYEVVDYLETVKLQTVYNYYASYPYPSGAANGVAIHAYLGSETYASYARKRFNIPFVFSEVPKVPPDPDDPVSIERFFADMDKGIKKGSKPKWRSYALMNRIETIALLAAQRIPRR